MRKLIIKGCCESFTRHVNRPCSIHKDFTCPDHVIRFYTCQFGLAHPDGISYYAIKYCPWCGADLKNVVRRSVVKPKIKKGS